MTISVFDLFKIGIGPSSSHTMGPMIAAKRFREALRPGTARISVELFGSLAWTGRGHGSDSAICLGLLGLIPSGVDPDAIRPLVSALRSEKILAFADQRRISFDPDRDIEFNLKTLLPRHSNALQCRAFGPDGGLVSEQTYYSIGGGFVLEEGEVPSSASASTPYPFESAAELLDMCTRSGLTVAEIQLSNETSLRQSSAIASGIDDICNAMFACIDRGFAMDGELPGPMKIRRRAKALLETLEAGRRGPDRHPHEIMDWVAAYAIAVNEENAAGGRVVTAPTNGAAGIIPAVLRYFRDFYPDYSSDRARVFLLSAAAIGSIIKANASISGAEVGCQGEVGSAASMAAAGLAAVLGGSPAQIENASEIAMEHHLGMTCDPIGGLVQIPCIERNAFGANKAIAAASLALRGDGTHRVSLDQVIETMRQTGVDMQTKYKETSRGGLAVNVPEC